MQTIKQLFFTIYFPSTTPDTSWVSLFVVTHRGFWSDYRQNSSPAQSENSIKTDSAKKDEFVDQSRSSTEVHHWFLTTSARPHVSTACKRGVRESSFNCIHTARVIPGCMCLLTKTQNKAQSGLVLVAPCFAFQRKWPGWKARHRKFTKSANTAANTPKEVHIPQMQQSR